MSNEDISYKQPLLETPFHSKTREKCHAHDWLRWAGYKVVRQYTNAELEYTAMRNTASVIDITPMHKYKIKGSQAKSFINKLITRDISFCLLYTSPSPRDGLLSRMPSSA